MSDDSEEPDVPLPPGYAPLEAKERVARLLSIIWYGNDQGFALPVAKRISVTDVTIEEKKDAPGKTETTLVCELDVQKDMVNAYDSLHGGASAYLVDVCSSLALAAAGKLNSVSQALNVVYHAPAPLGSHLRIMNWTITVGSRVMSTRTEIWDATGGRLVATGIHIKMEPSAAKL
ncbi:hypothetical protein PENSPDRAFT_571580 [Peniophora sp. CONT]|nr:hypothetical protein PENSPDRAFT_571580 [Peniophora sp. CONT]